MIIWGIITAFVSIVKVVNCDQHVSDLHKRLMNDYTKEVRPAVHFSRPTNVTFGYHLYFLVDVDEKEQILKTSSWLHLSWFDDRLTWNPGEFGGLKSLRLPSENLWRPDVVLTNNAEHKYERVLISTEAYVSHKGLVTWPSFAIFRSFCLIDVRFYPFDRQECNISFSSWTNDISKINLTLKSSTVDLTHFKSNGEWNLISAQISREIVLYSCCDQAYPVINVVLNIQRRSLFYVFNYIFPCIVITSMSLLGFCVPADAGGKCTLCITSMLSMGVFLKDINDSMPSTSSAVPLVGMYYAANLFIVALATVVNVVILHLHKKGDRGMPEPLPLWASFLLNSKFSSLIMMSCDEPEDPVCTADKDMLGNLESPQIPPKDLPRELDVPDVVPLHIPLPTAPAQIHQLVEGHNKSIMRKRYRTRHQLEALRRVNVISGSELDQRSTEDEVDQEVWVSLRQRAEEMFGSFLDRVCETLDCHTEQIVSCQKKMAARNQWSRVSLLLDRMFLICFIVSTVTTGVLMLWKPDSRH